MDVLSMAIELKDLSSINSDQRMGNGWYSTLDFVNRSLRLTAVTKENYSFIRILKNQF